MGFIATIIVGLIAGWLASLVMKTSTGLIVDMIIGVIGGFIGGLLSQLIFDVNLMSGVNVTSIITAFIGAVILIAIVKAIRR